MKIRIQDEGNGFDFNKKWDPTIEENLFKKSGRGLFIVKSLMENIEYKDTGKGTEIIITINKK
jgi:serine/threonine-protein kinase RsbW